MKLDTMTHKQLLELRDRLATSDSIIYKKRQLENSLVVTDTSSGEID
jgi:hypothetical protein